MPPKIEPRKKTKASLKQSAADPNNPRYMRVARGQAFPMTPQFRRQQQEITQLQNKYDYYASLIQRGGPGILAGSGASHLWRQRMVHIKNRQQTLRESQQTYIRQGVYQYPPRNPMHSWMYE